MREGGCQCGAVRYAAKGEPLHHALCHCTDCRASSGAPAVAWIAFPLDAVTVTAGSPVTYEGAHGARRQFCGTCGTGLLYTNAEMLPGIIDVQTATLDDARSGSASDVPGAQIQRAERLPWFDALADLPAFDRFPEG